MPVRETASASFHARHSERDADDAAAVLAQLERARADLVARFGPVAELPPLDVVLHPSPAALDLAAPWLALLRRRSAPAGRRYLVGWAGEDALHVLAPRQLAQRASDVPGSLELLMLAPAALLARRVVLAANPALPRGPQKPAWRHWAWLVEGASQWLSGQSAHVRPAVARRLREEAPPAFPPAPRDAGLLGGTVLELLAREEGGSAPVALVLRARGRDVAGALKDAFGGRGPRRTEDAWRSHLARIRE
jgi:hypothetical protein